MNLIGFELLCRQASQKLALADKTALATGSRVSIDGVIFETMFVEGQDSFLLMADVGAVEAQDRAGVYERLLTLQLAAWDDAHLRFGFHPMHESLVLCVGVTLVPGADSAWLASLLKSVAAQVAQWRVSVLADKVGMRQPGGGWSHACSVADATAGVFAPHP